MNTSQIAADMEDMITTREAQRITGYNLVHIIKLLGDGAVPGAQKTLGRWLVPKSWALSRAGRGKLARQSTEI
jgi:hypothetical protein